MALDWWGQHRGVSIRPAHLAGALARVRAHCAAHEPGVLVRAEGIFVCHAPVLVARHREGPPPWREFSHIAIAGGAFQLDFEHGAAESPECRSLARWILENCGPCELENELGQRLDAG